MGLHFLPQAVLDRGRDQIFLISKALCVCSLLRNYMITLWYCSSKMRKNGLFLFLGSSMLPTPQQSTIYSKTVPIKLLFHRYLKVFLTQGLTNLIRFKVSYDIMIWISLDTQSLKDKSFKKTCNHHYWTLSNVSIKVHLQQRGTIWFRDLQTDIDNLMERFLYGWTSIYNCRKRERKRSHMHVSFRTAVQG